MYIPQILALKFIYKKYNDVIIKHFGIKEINKLITRKSFEQIMRQDIKYNIEGYIINKNWKLYNLNVKRIKISININMLIAKVVNKFLDKIQTIDKLKKR